MELNNPLRPRALRPLPVQDAVVKPDNTLVKKEIQTQEIQISSPNADLFPNPTPSPTLNTEISKPTKDLKNDESELNKALALLAKHGMEIASPKKRYIKHTYEIAEDVFREFHEIYPILGIKNVKTAATEALKMWCEKNRAEYLRRKG